MRIIKELRTGKTVKPFIASLTLFIILFIMGDTCILFVGRKRESAIRVLQLNIYTVLSEHKSTPDASLPKIFSPVPIGGEEYYIEAANTYYYPGAWNKPSELLLKYRSDGFYYVIFGDGSRATLTYWYSPKEDSLSTRANLIGPTPAAKYMFGNLWMIPLGIVVIAINTLLITKAFLNKKELIGDTGADEKVAL